jgi:pyruvate-formate lyase-activating enzyme
MKINYDTFPDVVRIETSGLCNFQCKHCTNIWEWGGVKEVYSPGSYLIFF